MSLTQIKTFLTIVETGSLIRASKVLNVTQSTITARLKGLEDDIGQTLLHRQKSGVVLTASGVKFHRYAAAMSDMWRQAMLETSLPDGVDAVCNMGCDDDLWPILGRRLTSAVKFEHPKTALSVKSGDAAQTDEWLASGLIDAALSYHANTLDNIAVHTLGLEKLSLYSTKPDSPSRFDPDYIYIDAGSNFGRSHAATYFDAGIAKHSLSSARWGLDYLFDNGGSAYLPEALAEWHVPRGNLFRVEEAPTFTRPAYLLINETREASWPWLIDLAQRLFNE